MKMLDRALQRHAGNSAYCETIFPEKRPATSCRSALDYLMEDFKQFFSKHFDLLRAQSINFFQLG